MADKIPAKLAKMVYEGGFDFDAKTLTELKKQYAQYSLNNTYCDQFAARLGEQLGMIRMNREQLQKFVQEN